MSARTRRSRDEAKHEAILKAATRLFLRKGYSNTSMDAIAEAARVTKQTVYGHYKSKDALFTHMVSSLCEKHAPPGALAEKPGQKIDDLLYNAGMIFLDMLTSPEALLAIRLVIAEVHQHPKLAQRFYENGTLRMIAIFSQVLDGWNKRGLTAIPETTSAASYFFALLKGRYHLRMILGIKPVPDQAQKESHVREVVRMFLRIYGGSDPLWTNSVL